MSDTVGKPDFSDSVKENAGFVQSIAGSLLVDKQASDDVAQETWLAAWRAQREERKVSRSWLGVVTKNFAFRNRRDHKRRLRREERAARPERVISTEEIVQRERVLRSVVDAVLGLPEPYKSTVLLRFYDDMTPQEIARKLGASPNTVRSRLKRGLDMLRGQLDDDYDGRRESWCLALVPFAVAGTVAPPPIAGSADAASRVGLSNFGATIMGLSAMAKVAILVALLGGGVGIGLWAASGLGEVDGDLDQTATADVASEGGAAGVSRRRPGELRGAGAPVEDDGRLAPPTRIEEQPFFQGAVVDGEGGPVEGARVVLYKQRPRREQLIYVSNWQARWREPGALMETRSDRDGLFSFPEAADGTYYYVAHKDGVVGLRADVLVESAREPVQVEVKILAAKRLNGLVVDQDGDPVAGAEVLLRRDYISGYPPEPSHVTRAVTDGSGRFAFEGYGQEQHIAVRKPGYVDTHVDRVATRRRAAPELVEITLRRGRTVELQFDPAPGVTLPEALTFVVTCDEEPAFARFGRTDARGRATLADVPATKDIRVLVDHPGLAVPRSSKTGDSSETVRGRLFDLPGDPEQVVHVPVTMGGVIRGRVVDRVTGEGVAGVPLEADPSFMGLMIGAAHHRPRTVSGPNGVFEFSGLIGAPTVLTTSSMDWVHAPKNWFEVPVLMAYLAPQTLPVCDVQPGRTVETTFHVVRAAAMTGTVVDGSGDPVSGCKVEPLWVYSDIRVPLAKAKMIFEDRRVLTDEKGRFRISGLPPGGRVRLKLRHEDFAPSRTQPVTIHPGETVEDVRLVVDEGATVRGTFVDDKGVPLAGIRVGLSSGHIAAPDSAPFFAITNDQGVATWHRFQVGRGFFTVPRREVVPKGLKPPAGKRVVIRIEKEGRNVHRLQLDRL